MRKLFSLILVAIVGVLGLITLFSHMILDFLWLYEQGFVNTIIRIFAYRWLTIPLFGLSSCILFFIYLLITAPFNRSSKKIFFTKLLAVTVYAMVFEYQTEVAQGIIYAILAGFANQKIASIDASVYLFWLPLFQKTSLFWLSIFGVNTLLNIALRSAFDRLSISLTVLFVMIYLIVSQFEMTIARQQGEYLGFLDIYGRFLPFVASVILIGVFILLFLWVLSRKNKSTYIIGTVFALIVVLLNTAFPPALDMLVYNPNKSSFQIFFANLYAESTRKAFQLDSIQRGDHFIFEEDDISSALANNYWNDASHFVQFVKNRQEILPIFNISNASTILMDSNGVSQPYFIANRDLEENPSEDWDIKHFRNIFGYGAVAGSVSAFDEQGFPVLTLKDLEMEASLSNFHLKNPQIFFGDSYNNYVFVNTEMLIPNFGKPATPLEKQSFPEVKGIPVNFFTRVMLAIMHRDQRFILTDYITDDTKLVLYRKPSEIVRRILPMFEFDKPRLILHNQELWWVLEGYSLSDSVFLSKKSDTPWGQYNWVRSPVRAYVSAHTGEVKFEIIDERDPHAKIAKTLFPNLFNTSFRVDHHLYPEKLFDIQSRLLETFHEVNGASFYSGLTRWEISKPLSSNEPEPIKNIFLSSENEIAFQRTYTAFGKNIFTSRLLGFVDKNNKQQLYLYQAPANLGTLGLAQAEAFLNQDQNFSRLATLWDQRGSKVTRSDTIFYPMKTGGFYAQTVFLESESIQIPMATRFVIMDQTRVILENSVPEIATSSAIGQGDTVSELTPLQQMRAIVLEAYQYFLNAQSARLSGETQEYSQNVDKIGETLQKADL